MQETVMSISPRLKTGLAAVALSALLVAGCTRLETATAPHPEMLARLQSLAPHACNPQTASALQERGIVAARVQRAYHWPNTVHGYPVYVIGYTTKVSVAGESADLIVNHDDACQVTRVAAN